MTIPANLTHAEVGIFLQAVGLVMERHDVCFDAALDGCNEDDMVRNISTDLFNLMDPATIGWRELVTVRAKELLTLTGEEAVNFIQGHTP